MTAARRRSAPPRPGSGITTQLIMEKLMLILSDSMEEQLRAIAVRPKGHGSLTVKQIEILRVGFTDGMRAMLAHLVKMGVIRIVDDEPAVRRGIKRG